jgi:hypothetical protein
MDPTGVLINEKQNTNIQRYLPEIEVKEEANKYVDVLMT